MNIQQEALYRALDGVELKDSYLTESYQLLYKKIKQYQRKKGSLPSAKFLNKSVSKFSKDSDIISDLDGITEALIDYDKEELTNDEVKELLLDDYKKRKVRDLAKLQAEATIEEKWELVDRYSNEIHKISSIRDDDRFLTRDIKQDIDVISTKTQTISTGIFPKDNLPISKVPTGSLVSITGRSGLGKSQMAIMSFINQGLDGKNCLLISYEMPKNIILARIKSYLAEVPYEEVESGNYSVSESKDRVTASEYTIKKDTDFESCLSLLKKSGEEALKELPDRENIMKILAANDKNSFDLARQKGEPIEDLPNDSDIISYLNEYGESLDCVYIDLISNVNFSNGFSSREENITSFVKELNHLGLIYGLVTYIVSQVKDEKSPYGYFQPKYSQEIYQSASLYIALVSTQELRESNAMAICLDKNRNGVDKKAFLAESGSGVMGMNYMGQTEDMYDIIEMMKKDLKGDKK